MSKRHKPKIADKALLAQLHAAQERFERLYAEVEGKLGRCHGVLEREDKLIGLATRLLQEGPGFCLPDGPTPLFPAQSVLEVQIRTYKAAMFDVLMAVVRGDFRHLERELEPQVLPLGAPDFDAFDDEALSKEC
jgi:hypothetical protein